MRVITKYEKQYLLSLKPEDLSLEVFVDLFGNKAKTLPSGKVESIKSKFEPMDIFELSPSEYFIKKKGYTSVGKFFYNKYIVEYLHLEDVLGYVDWELTNSGLSKVEAILSQALQDDIITVSTFKTYIDRRDNMGEQFHPIITPSITMNLIKTPKEVTNKKKELVKKYKNELDKKDVVTAINIEQELLKTARDILKDDVGMELYASGARGSFENSYKNMNIMRGPVFNNITGEYDIVQSSLMDGIDKKDMPPYGNSVVAGNYRKAVETQVSGYLAKQILAALQGEVLDVKDSDCGTKGYLDLLITEKNFRDFYYRYIIEKDKLVELTPDIIKKYIGKEVKLRSPMMCVGDKKCNMCMGNMFYKLGIENIGLTTSRVATTLTKLGFKKIHVSNMSVQKVDVNSLLI